MIEVFIPISIVFIFCVIWIISTKGRLMMLEESIKNSASQIDTQLSRRFDAMGYLIDIIKIYIKYENEIAEETIVSEKSLSPSRYTIEDILVREKIILKELGKIQIITEEYPDLKTNQSYIKAMESMKNIENMIHTSRLIYNDGVYKLNREIRMFPVSLIARTLGFKQKEYIEEI